MFTSPLPTYVNHRKLAQENNKLEGTIPLNMFKRLGELLASRDGNVQVRLEFRRGNKRKTQIIGMAFVNTTLVCQRCLSGMEHELEANLRHFIVVSDEALLELEENEDGIVSVEDKVLLADLLEDELIINLPMVAKHVPVKGQSECPTVAVHENDTSPIEVDTHRPFAGLADSLKREEE